MRTWTVRAVVGLWALGLVGGAVAADAEGPRRVERLEREARALANPRGCDKVEECELAELGHKACGGPRAFVAYCSRTTDARALRSRLEALEQAEKALQQASGEASNCGLTRRPRLRWEGAECLFR